MAIFSNDDDNYPQPEPSFLSKVWSAVKWVGMALLAVVGVTALLRNDTVKGWLDKVTEKKESGIVTREGWGTKFNEMFDKNIATNETYKKIAAAATNVKEKAENLLGFETRPEAIIAAQRTKLEQSADAAGTATVTAAEYGAGVNTALAVGKKLATGLQTLGPDGKPLDKPTKLQNKLEKLKDEWKEAKDAAKEARATADNTFGLSDKVIEKNQLAATKAEKAATELGKSVTQLKKDITEAAKAAAAPKNELRAVKWIRDTHADIGDRAADIGDNLANSKLLNRPLESIQELTEAKYVKPVTGLMKPLGRLAEPALKGAGVVGAAYGAAMDGLQTKELYDAGEYKGAALEGVNTAANLGNTYGVKGMGVAEIIQDSAFLLRKATTGGLVDGKEDVSKGMLGTLVDHEVKKYADKNIQATNDAIAKEQDARNAEAQAKYNSLSDEGKAEVQAVMAEAQQRGLTRIDGMGAIMIAEHRHAQQQQEALSAPVTPAKPKDEKEARGPRKHQPVGPGA